MQYVPVQREVKAGGSGYNRADIVSAQIAMEICIPPHLVPRTTFNLPKAVSAFTVSYFPLLLSMTVLHGLLFLLSTNVILPLLHCIQL